MADALGMDQSEVSRIGRRTDVLLSTLRRFVRATGGKMQIVVTYPDGEPVQLDLGKPLTLVTVPPPPRAGHRRSSAR